MATTSRTKLRTAVKNEVTATLLEWVKATYGEDAALVKDNEIMMPVVDAEGNEDYVVFKVTIPIGEGHGQIAYDGYAEAEAYAREKAEKAEKARLKEEAKAKKIAKDKAAREAKAKAKANAENTSVGDVMTKKITQMIK